MKFRGIDAPIAPVLMGLGVILLIGLAIVQHQWFYWFLAVYLLACLGLYLNASLRGKAAIIEETIQKLHLKSDAQVLDLGTGHGVALLKIAQHLESPGQVIGIDLWKKGDQSGNSIEKTRANIKAALIADKASVQTADMLNLPFKDRQFDCVFASIAIHNVKPAINRARALQEAVRVLKADGTIAIIDLEHVDEYKRMLQGLGFQNITVQKCGVNGWWSGPWVTTKVLIAKRF